MLFRPFGPCAYTTTLLLWSSLSLCLASYNQTNTTNVPGYTLRAGVNSVPQPLSVAPDQGYAGIDGQWNTFSLRVGAQQSVVQVLPSTASQQIWVVNQEACRVQYLDLATNNLTEPEADPDCERNRGFVFNTNTSSTWVEQGFYDLWVGGTYGKTNTGYFGYDTVALGLPGEEGPTVSHTTIGTLKYPNTWLGHIGLHSKSTNFSANLVDTPPVPSYITRLFEQGNIPSVSFGYTAGAKYGYDVGQLSSLTLGGYDSSLYIPNKASFVFAPDNERDLTVGLAGLNASTTTQSDINLIPHGLGDLSLIIDTTVAELWLPEAVCDVFEKAFGLTYDNATQLYLVDDLLHQTLLAQDPTVTISLQQRYTSNETVQIRLPYAAFDLEAQAPYQGLKNNSRYFPLRRGKDKNQWTLGRMFLQEAYLTVDWERARFSVSQVSRTSSEPNIVAIVSPDYLEKSHDDPGSSDSRTALKIGVAVGCVFLVLLVGTAVAGYYWRRRTNALAIKRRAEIEAARKSSPTDTDETPSSPVTEKGPNVFPKAELPGYSGVRRYEMGASDKGKGDVEVLEVENTEQPIYEMLGDVPAPQEAASRQLSEKETMMVRERNINGSDPHAESQPVRPVTRPAPIACLDEIAMVSPRLPGDGVSPVTPRAPRDGALLEAGDTFSPLPPYRTREGRLADEMLSPISPLEAPSRRRFSYES